MFGIYLGIMIFFAGTVWILINRKTECPMNGDFWDVPIRIKIGILSVISGILIMCASILFMVITNPMALLG